MKKIILLLGCFACLGHGRRVKLSALEKENLKLTESRRARHLAKRRRAGQPLTQSDFKVTANLLRALAKSLLATRPRAAFGPSAPGARLQTHISATSLPIRHHGFSHIKPMMNIASTEVLHKQEVSSDIAEAAKTASGHAAPAANDTDLDGKAPNKTEDSYYFSAYQYLYHQMVMLEDQHRVTTYMEAMKEEPEAFKDKVVLDVGAGSGVLAIFAAQAGARQVYAVEATNMAQRAKDIVEANGLSDKIRVIQGTMETVELPEKVDIIVSEWMGMFLLRESMLDSVIFARDRWLKDGGALFPSHATMYIAPIRECEVMNNMRANFEGDEKRWEKFEKEMWDRYDINFTCVKDDFLREQRRHYLQTGMFAEMLKDSLCGTEGPFLHLDVNTVTVESLANPKNPLKCLMTIDRDGPVQGFLCWFDTDFKGSDGIPVSKERKLTTAPPADRMVPQTHWAQQAFAFIPPIECKKDDVIEGSMLILRQPKNGRLLILETEFILWRQGQIVGEPRNETYFIN